MHPGYKSLLMLALFPMLQIIELVYTESTKTPLLKLQIIFSKKALAFFVEDYDCHVLCTVQ